MTLIPALERELIAAAEHAYRLSAEAEGARASLPAWREAPGAAGHRPRRRWLRRWAAMSAGALALAAVAGIAIALLSTGTTAAFAGWTATPSAPTAGALAAARTACGNVPTTDVLAADARGPYTAIAFTRAGKPWQCVVKGSHVVVDVSNRYPVRAYASVPPGKVMLPVITQKTFGSANAQRRALIDRWLNVTAGKSSQPFKRAIALRATLRMEIAATMSGPDTLSAVIGVAGSGVRAVTFILADGDRVQATVEHGWYVAWWPGASKPGGATAVRVAVTTSSGTHSSPLPAPPKLDVSYQLPAQGCVPGDRCSVLVPLELTAKVAKSLTAHFSMFRDTAPTELSREPTAVQRLIQSSASSGRFRGDRGIESMQMRTGMSLGLDAAQARSLYLGNHITLWLIPGSEGTCRLRVSAGGGGGSCGPVNSLLRYGAIENAGTVTVHGVTRYLLGGFVPDGNPTITVRLDSGAARTIPVKHNAFTSSFTSQPASVTFKDAAGKVITDPAPGPNEA
jgi:hypothetical protein